MINIDDLVSNLGATWHFLPSALCHLRKSTSRIERAQTLIRIAIGAQQALRRSLSDLRRLYIPRGDNAHEDGGKSADPDL